MNFGYCYFCPDGWIMLDDEDNEDIRIPLEMDLMIDMKLRGKNE